MSDAEIQEIVKRWAAVPPWLPWVDAIGVFFSIPEDAGARPMPGDEWWRLTTGNIQSSQRLLATWEAYRQAGTDVAALLAEVKRLRMELGEKR